MRRKIVDIKTRRSRSTSNELMERLASGVVGQPDAVEAVVPYVQMYQAGLVPEGRPAGVFLLLGPTGTGKTRTVEALAEVLHGNSRNVLRVDCGEYQMDHEAAKLTGAPPGYLGHRETQPLLTQNKINAVSSEYSSLSLILFDEIEKASLSVMRLLLGVLDKATLRLGDNSIVNFERTMIFLTSNLGAQGIMREMKGKMGFASQVPVSQEVRASALADIAEVAARRHFSPEFLNRMDAIVTYQPLTQAALSAILDQQLAYVRRLIAYRLGNGAFDLLVTEKARRFLLSLGFSDEYGARELKRVIHRHILQPLACLVVDCKVAPGCAVKADLARGGFGLTFSW